MKFFKYFISIFFTYFFVYQIQAQVPRVVSSTNSTVNVAPVIKSENLPDSAANEDEPDDSINAVPENFSNSLNYLTENWAVEKNTSIECESLPNPATSDDIYKERLKKLPCLIEMPYNTAVKSFIEIYTQRNRKQVEYLLGLSQYYFPIFEAALEEKRLPLELKYLPIIESALNPRAISRAGATGIWQFMIGTGKMYGLEVNSLVDERMDPVKSSKIAAELLKELYSIYSDWHLAIAAYNCGASTINKAINRAGGKRDFWAIYPFLPAETRSYVPIFIAANYVMNYADKHNICPSPVKLPSLTDTIMLNRRVHLAQISAILNLPIDELRLLNPQYRADIIPGDIKPYPVCLPHNYAGLFIDKCNEIYAYNASSLVENRRDEIELPKTIYSHSSHKATKTRHFIKVKKGQNLSTIAERYGTTVAKLKKANGLKSTKLKPGQHLRIPK